MLSRLALMVQAAVLGGQFFYLFSLFDDGGVVSKVGVGWSYVADALAAAQDGDASSTVAVEAASGALSRAFASPGVVRAAWVQECLSPAVLAQMGSDLIRSGDSMYVMRRGADGMVRLIPASSQHFEGSHDPATWTVRVTAYGPSTSTTWNLSASVVRRRILTQWTPLMSIG